MYNTKHKYKNRKRNEINLRLPTEAASYSPSGRHGDVARGGGLTSSLCRDPRGATGEGFKKNTNAKSKKSKSNKLILVRQNGGGGGEYSIIKDGCWVGEGD